MIKNQNREKKGQSKIKSFFNMFAWAEVGVTAA